MSLGVSYATLFIRNPETIAVLVIILVPILPAQAKFADAPQRFAENYGSP